MGGHRLHQVSGGARQGGDDGPGLLKQGVEQGGLPHVGASHQPHPDALPKQHPSQTTLPQILRPVLQGPQPRPQVRLLQGGDLLLREVQQGLQVGRQVRGPSQEIPEGLPGASLKGPARRRQGFPAAGTDHREHRLRLGEVQPSVGEGPAGELSGLGQAGSQGEKQVQARLGGQGSPVAVQLPAFLAGVALRGGEAHRQDLVQDLPLRVDHVSVAHPPGFRPGQGDPTPKGPVQQGGAPVPGEAQHRDAPLPPGGGEGGDHVPGRKGGGGRFPVPAPEAPVRQPGSISLMACPRRLMPSSVCSAEAKVKQRRRAFCPPSCLG